MDQLLLIAIPTLPLIMAMGSPIYRSGTILILPPCLALIGALSIPLDTSVSLPWLLLGVDWRLDATGRAFLLCSALIWLVAAVYVSAATEKPCQSRVYRCLFLTAMGGNLLLIVAADMLSFYLGFAMMGLSAYGLILKRSQRARRAARIYLGFTLVGELALFTALLLLVSGSGSTLFSELQTQQVSDIAIGLLILGFGIKLALPGLHVWLPLTYSTAPLISVAVLSGPMMKAGLLGWIRFVPIGAENLTDWGQLLTILGGAGILLGSLLALLQHKASAVLAYSSVAKMGLVSALFGYALANPQLAEPIVAALVLFAMHHLLIKSALFLGLHEYIRNGSPSIVFAGLTMLALSLLGLPFSGGAAAKLELDAATAGGLNLLLVCSAFAGTLMMLHFLQRVRQSSAAPKKASATSAGINPGVFWWLLLPVAWWAPFVPSSFAVDTKSLFIIGSGLLAYLFIQRYQSGTRRLPDYCRPGDLYHLLLPVRLANPFGYKSTRTPAHAFLSPGEQQNDPGRANQTSLATAGLAWLVVTMLLIAALLTPIT